MFTSIRSGGLFALLALTFFHISATTFASLGVVLPAMIADLKWSWTEAGFGFTALALFTGLFSPVAATSLNRLGLRGNYAAGGAAMAAGFAAMAAAEGLFTYLLATSLLGAGFALLANVPSVYVAARIVVARSRNFMIGLYLAAGGAGGVAGPLIANATIAGGEDWRLYWRFAAAASLALAALTVAVAKDGMLKETPDTTEAPSEKTPALARDWTLREAVRAPAFYIVGGALMAAYFCSVSVSSWAVTHLTGLGLSAGFASLMLSLHAAANAAARAAGGLAVKKFDAKALLLSALVAEAIGMTALAFGAHPGLAILFAIFEGYAFGMILFATTVIAIDYFGLKHSPAVLGAMNLFATVAMLGPTLTGATGDVFGSFSPIFLVYAAGAALLAVGVAFLRNPNR